ncbi:MAG TPA: membrane protein insertion efficiency factor YidD [Leptospiraceae bacterium]|nr:membrane protein insertion efficiency factor YidD [Leptospiraceae bacterium]HMW08208.1 membrane protein insertion efficiency factor YidD [Leptospiraceae bacterium]HMX35356.1 membrane protein insertion efficiency factor YidD [Leptospiraceae bacterium]HMZ64620.1 membrane protein insertion efficiency factor YidD [Leptospiraceae bacterium]HNA09098.1 membrane protein insertion efficiency factor YidD [Leptospiraceae bacterium]
MNQIAILLIHIYKKFISPLLPGACRFYPSCSEYALQAFKEYGFLKAFYLTVNRVSRCNPMSEGYFDPLPPNPNKKN